MASESSGAGHAARVSSRRSHAASETSAPHARRSARCCLAEWLQQEVLEPVPHRHVVLTMPRLLRPTFRKRRELLLDLSQCGAEALAKYTRTQLGADVRPGLVVSIASSGDLLEWHPHTHVLATDGSRGPSSRWQLPKPRQPGPGDAHATPPRATSRPARGQKRDLPGTGGQAHGVEASGILRRICLPLTRGWVLDKSTRTCHPTVHAQALKAGRPGSRAGRPG